MSDELMFDPGEHTYEADGVVYPSVTQILQGVGIIDTRWYKPGSAEKGAAKHKLFEQYLKKTLDWSTLTDEALALIEQYQNFLTNETAEILCIEKARYSKELGYAGTPDLVYRDKDGKVIVLDIKTGAPEKWHALQLAAYMELEKPYHSAKEFSTTSGGRLLYIDVKKYTLKNPGVKDALEVFKAATRVARWKA